MVLGLIDNFIQKTKKQYQDARSQRNLQRLNEDLGDVTRIMTKNVQEVLGRGEYLDRNCVNRHARTKLYFVRRKQKVPKRHQVLELASTVAEIWTSDCCDDDCWVCVLSEILLVVK